MEIKRVGTHLKEHRKVTEQAGEITELKASVSELKAALADQAAQIQKVSAQVQTNWPAAGVASTNW